MAFDPSPSACSFLFLFFRVHLIKFGNEDGNQDIFCENSGFPVGFCGGGGSVTNRVFAGVRRWNQDDIARLFGG